LTDRATVSKRQLERKKKAALLIIIIIIIIIINALNLKKRSSLTLREEER